nr:unnamed protein product [Callosobruchus analis]
MLSFSRNLEKILLSNVEKTLAVSISYSTETKKEVKEEFRILNLKNVKGKVQPRKPQKQLEALQPRATKMPVDQDWGSVWPGPKSFHPATVPLPVRQGYVEKAAPAPDKYGNAELIKIPNFLHLTPPVIKRQCEALKKFCTPWPKGLENDETCEKHFPIEVVSSDYCHSAPTIRNPLARIVTIKLKLSSLKLDERAKDKFIRLVGECYNKETDTVTIVADRCPLKKQNYDYAMYLLTACYHESWNVEPWEELKSEADMEYYNWNNNASKKSVEALFGKPTEDIPNVQEYSEAVSTLINEGKRNIFAFIGITDIFILVG